MKYQEIYHKITYLSVIITITCWNGSLVDTSNKEKRPDINFYGHLQDHSSQDIKVEDILIGGKYEQIPVFQLLDEKTLELLSKNPKNSNDAQNNKIKELDPRQNKVLLDLQEISSIELKHPDQPVEHELDINNKKYIQIIITNITGTKNEYLIENNRELTCKKIDKGPKDDQKPVLEERKLNIIHVKKLIISGEKSNPDKIKSTARDAAESDKGKISQETEKILDEMEQKVNNLPKEDPSNYQKVKESLLSLLRSLRNQLQKLVDMIKN